MGEVVVIRSVVLGFLKPMRRVLQGSDARLEDTGLWLDLKGVQVNVGAVY